MRMFGLKGKWSAPLDVEADAGFALAGSEEACDSARSRYLCWPACLSTANLDVGHTCTAISCRLRLPFICLVSLRVLSDA